MFYKYCLNLSDKYMSVGWYLCKLCGAQNVFTYLPHESSES